MAKAKNDTVNVDTASTCPCGKTGKHLHERAQHERIVDRAGDHCDLAGPPQTGALRRLLGRS